MNLLTNTPCPCCHSVLGPDSLPYINRLYGGAEAGLFDHLQLVFCEDCGLGMAVPFVAEKDLLLFYERAYRKTGTAHAKQLEAVGLDEKYGQRAFSQLQLLRTFWRGTVAPASVMDIGAGHGDLLKAARVLFPACSLSAMEPDLQSHPRLNSLGADVFGFLLAEGAAQRVGRQFDAVMCSHVLEHFSADALPALIKELALLLSCQGLLFVEVPFGGVNQYPDLRLNDAPHLSFFTETSLKRLLGQEFAVLYCGSVGVPFKESFSALNRIEEQAGRTGPTNNGLGLQTRLKWLAKRVGGRPLRKILDLRHKLQSPEYYDFFRADYYDYGAGDRSSLRVVCAKKS